MIEITNKQGHRDFIVSSVIIATWLILDFSLNVHQILDGMGESFVSLERERTRKMAKEQERRRGHLFSLWFFSSMLEENAGEEMKIDWIHLKQKALSRRLTILH